MTYETVIGLEIHLKLNSPNKLFCQCANMQNFDELEANTHICPVCTGQPGALPVLNREPLEKAIQLGLALGCTVAPESHFDRKSYFYPDLPMGYQITQQNSPTNINGSVTYFVDKGYTVQHTVEIRDAHIETDTGKATHEGGASFLDFNRAGTPLIEIVTQPDFRTSEQVVSFLKELQRIARYNDISDAEIEKGQMRVDVNISIRPEGSTEYGTRNELKNMSSFSAIQKSIEIEVARQTALLESGGEVEQATRGRDDMKQDSYVMRSKENAMDYRYFPEPDIPMVHIDDEMIAEIRQHVDEGPYRRIVRYTTNYGFNKEYINGLLNDSEVNSYFEQCVADGADPKAAATWIVGPIARWSGEAEGQQVRDIQTLPFSREGYMSFLGLLSDGKITSSQAKTVMKKMLETADGDICDPAQIVEELGYKPVTDDQIQAWIDEILDASPELRAQLAAGEKKPMGFITGQVMKKSGGSADPQKVGALLGKIAG